jgi:hypothetical protein
VFAFGFQRLRRGLELGLLFGQFGLDRRALLAQRRDFADHRVDRRVLFGDRFRQRRRVGLDAFQLVARAFELFLRRLGRGAARERDREDAERRQEQRREQQHAALESAWIGV